MSVRFGGTRREPIRQVFETGFENRSHLIGT